MITKNINFRVRPVKYLKIKNTNILTGNIISNFANKCFNYYKLKNFKPKSSIVIYVDNLYPNLKKVKLSEKKLEYKFPGTILQKRYTKRCSKPLKHNRLIILKRIPFNY